MTRTEANDLIKKALTAEQANEFRYRFDLRQETIDDELERFGETDCEAADYVDVLLDIVDLAEDVVHSASDPMWRRDARADLKAYNRMLLVIGFYRPATADEIETSCTWSSRTGRMQRTKFLVIDGVKVTADESFSVFLECLNDSSDQLDA